MPIGKERSSQDIIEACEIKRETFGADNVDVDEAFNEVCLLWDIPSAREPSFVATVQISRRSPEWNGGGHSSNQGMSSTAYKS